MIATPEQFEEWCRRMRRGTDGTGRAKAPRTVEKYVFVIEYVEKRLDVADAVDADATFDAVLRVLDDMRESLAATTFNNTVNALQSLYQSIGQPERVDDLPKLARLPRPTPRVPADDDVEVLLRYPWSLQHRVIFGLMARLGPRVSEVVGARWEDVDWRGGYLYIPKAKYGSSRRIPLTKHLLALLRELQEKRSNGTPWVFRSAYREGKHVDMQAPRKALRRACRTLGIPHMSPHDLRRWFATKAVSKDMPLAYVRAFLGHATLATTQHYVAALPDARVKEACEKLWGDG